MKALPTRQVKGTISLKVLYNLSFKINIVDNLENTEKHGEENKNNYMYITFENRAF